MSEVDHTRFPFFHRPTLLRRISTREYLSEKAFFAATMSICALASARARDGALYLSKWNQDYFREPASEDFLAAAIAALPSDWSTMKELDWMRTCAVLALLGIQVGNISMMHQYLGMYHSLMAMNGLHDEKNWPEVGMVEAEERRRLVSMAPRPVPATDFLVLEYLYPRSLLIRTSYSIHYYFFNYSLLCC